MSFNQYRDVYQDMAGNAIAGALVSVVLTGTTTPATLFADSEGVTPIEGNVVTTDEYGVFTFYTYAGYYDLTLVATGYTTRTMSGVQAIGVGAYAAGGDNDDITSLTGLHRVVVTDTGAPTGDSDALVDAQGIETTWALNIRRRDTGHDSRVSHDGSGWNFEHPVRNTLAGRTFTLDDSLENVLGQTYQGAVIKCGTTEAGANLLDFIANAAENDIVTSFIVEAVTYAVDFSPSTGGDELNYATDAVTLAAGEKALIYCTAADGWILVKLGGTAVLHTITTAQIGTVTAVPGRDLYYVSDYGGGTYWVPDSTGTLFNLNTARGQQATTITIAQLAEARQGLWTPDLAGLYKVTDWPNARGSYWAEHDGELLPFGPMYAVKDLTPVTGAKVTTKQVLNTILLIPAGTLITGMHFRMTWGAVKNPAAAPDVVTLGYSDAHQFEIQLGLDAGGTVNTTLMTTASATTKSNGHMHHFYVASDTSIQRVIGASSDDMLLMNATGGTVPAAITVDDLSTNDLYLSLISNNEGSGTEAMTVVGYMVEFFGG